MPERHDNTIHKPFLRSKIIIITLSNITRTGLTICMEDPKEAPSVDYIHIEDTKVEETTIVDIAITTHSIRSNAISVISLDTN
jgi:hypothetical protein